jgi:tRNA (guanine-N7-)-methyltransferase
LPRIRFAAEQAKDPAGAFSPRADKVWLEVGFGAGEHALAVIGAGIGAGIGQGIVGQGIVGQEIIGQENVGLIGCEVFENGVASLLSALVPEGTREGAEESPALPGNLRLWTEDARALIRALPARSVERFFLLFPDPWPKARHAKRRFLHPLFLPEIARVVAPGGELRTATDDAVLQEWTAEVLAGQDFFDVPAAVGARPEGWPATRYEAKALAAGRRALYWRAVRRG